MIIRRESTKEDKVEYVEFEIEHTKKLVIAQKGAGGHWFIFLDTKGKQGYICTLGSYPPSQKCQAIKAAYIAARTIEEIKGG